MIIRQRLMMHVHTTVNGLSTVLPLSWMLLSHLKHRAQLESQNFGVMCRLHASAGSRAASMSHSLQNMAYCLPHPATCWCMPIDGTPHPWQLSWVIFGRYSSHVEGLLGDRQSARSSLWQSIASWAVLVRVLVPLPDEPDEDACHVKFMV